MSNNAPTNFQVHAPAKLLLLGEYLAILGESALGTSLPQKMTMQCSTCDAEFIIHSKETISQNFYIYLKKLCATLEIPYPRGIVEVTSDIPVAVGLGSSAAFSVCIAKILLLSIAPQTDENTLCPHAIWKLAHRIEEFFHKTASGIDTAIVSFGGTVLVEKSQMKNDNPSNFVIRHIELPLQDNIYIGNRPRHQGKKTIPHQVGEIMRLLQSNDSITNKWLSIHRKAMHYVLDYIMHGPKDEFTFLKTFGHYITELHYILSQLKMSVPEIDKIIQKNIENGAWGGKITGACFGGSFYILSKNIPKLCTNIN